MRADNRRGNLIFFAILIGLWAALGFGAPAYAAKLQFGTQDYLEKLQEVDVQGPNGEKLYLAHKYSFVSFIAPYRLIDGGYVLAVEGEKRYVQLEEGLIEALQARGQLPIPLPPYEIGPADYAMGHALWIMVAVMMSFVIIGMFRRKRRKKAVPLFRAGFALHEQGKIDEAIAEYTKALAVDPKFADAQMLRARAYEQRGDCERALADYSRLVKSHPKSDQPLIARSLVFAKKGLFEQAISDQARAIKLSKSPLAYFHRGTAFSAKGDDTRAIEDFTAALTRAPNFVDARRSRAVAHARAGRSEQAQEDLAILSNLLRAQTTPSGHVNTPV